MMSKKISKIETFNYQNIVTVKQIVENNRYLILDLWEDIRLNDIKILKNNRYKQIFLQINDLMLTNYIDNIAYFDLTDRSDVIDAMSSIEHKLINILKNYLSSIKKKGRFTFRSIIKDDRGSIDHSNKVVLELNLKNKDYDISFYDIMKNHSNSKIFNNKDSKFNVILEIMSINFDMIKGEIVSDTRLRIVMESAYVIMVR